VCKIDKRQNTVWVFFYLVSLTKRYIAVTYGKNMSKAFDKNMFPSVTLDKLSHSWKELYLKCLSSISV